MAKKRYRGVSDREFYTALVTGFCVLVAGIGAIDAFNDPKISKKSPMKLEKIADVDTFETIEPLYDITNDSVYFNVEDRRNHVDYGKLKGGKLELYDINRNVVFDKKFKEDEIVEVKSEYLSQDKYMVKYSSGSTHYNITFGKK